MPIERYRAAMEEFPIVTVDVVFLSPDKKKILLGKRINEPYAGEFYSFGGRLYKNEDFVDAAIRIAKQELDISLTPQTLTFAGALNEINDSSIFEGLNYHAVDVYFVCTIENKETALDAQHSEVQWFPVDAPDLHPNVKARIHGALKAI